ncbi:putative Non-specific protein-tyrosine kinase [Candidatus Sulfotelmatobacter kueseliae]|uniref:Putative Non-specific protein-tyrosine kinase n=1 Tax=Candidatus Sulfotelmatobacter kueseliae TaxID=2042962 RepID=A0A2U3KU02_9BACT|nr:putative Non-specific protein-tyrosine kinase [Candidatus Sulfotelmatobacter kueseliae]
MASAEARRVWEGRVVAGKFPLREWLGGTEHGAVFLTERKQPSSPATQKAAIKLIAADAGNAERQLSRWRAAAQLSHPHLIRIFEADRCQLNGSPLLYAVMEYADEDLSQILPQRPLTPEEVADLLPPSLEALSYLHGKGFVHGGIKPSNILAVGEQIKLSADQVTSLGEMHSRPRRDVYDPPEKEAGIVSPAGDLWSLGITLLAVLTQKTPSSAEEAQVPGLLEKMPEPFRGIARECLHLDPKRRCSIAQIEARLAPAARSVPVQPQLALPGPQRSMNKGMITVAVAVVALLIGLVVFYPRGENTPGRESTSEQTAPVTKASTPQPGEPLKQAVSQGEVLHQVLPDIPQSAMDTITGTIKINVLVEVDSSGKVTAAKFVTRGPSEYFAERVLKAVQGWEFSPPEVAGQPAPSAWVIYFRLRRASIQASAEKSR